MGRQGTTPLKWPAVAKMKAVPVLGLRYLPISASWVGENTDILSVGLSTQAMFRGRKERRNNSWKGSPGLCTEFALTPSLCTEFKSLEERKQGKSQDRG